MNDEANQYDVLVMVVPKDFERLKYNYKRLSEYLPGRNIYFVGNEEVGERVRRAGLGGRVGWIDENSVLPFDRVHAVMEERMSEWLEGRPMPRNITGWYYQQFLKMQYARMCKDEYYMVWDGDTIPCRHFSMFSDEGRPYLDLKHEYHEEYFNTLTKLVPDLHKCIDKSFISEHMLMRCDIMCELLADIEKAEYNGTEFWEKILWSIEMADIQSNSFSEFESYGTYIALRHPECYKLRNWNSFRYGGAYFHSEAITDDDYDWLGKDFFAISFEKAHSVRADHENLFNNKEYQSKLSARKMLELAQEDYEGDSYKEVWDT